MRKISGFFLFIFHTHALAHTQTNARTQTSVFTLVFLLFRQDATHFAWRLSSKWRVLQSSCSTFRVSTGDKLLKSGRWPCAHCLFIIIYISAKNQTVPFVSVFTTPRDRPLARRGSRCHWKLVDPCQLLYYLNHLVHCGFTLHAAAIIDLKLNDTELWGSNTETNPPQCHSASLLHLHLLFHLSGHEMILKASEKNYSTLSFCQFFYLSIIIIILYDCT